MALTLHHPKLHHDEPLADGVRRILQARLRENIRLLTEPTDDLDTAVHDARKNCKRIRAVLRLIRFEIDERQYRSANETVRDASRLLAPMRDGWVMVQALDGLAKDSHVPQSVVDPVRAELMAAYQQVRAAFLKDPDVLPTAVAMFEQVQQEVAAFPLERTVFEMLAPGLKRIYRQGRRGYARAYPVHDDPHLYHDWRKRVKYLWYQLDVLKPMWPGLLNATIVELKRIAKPLGEAHDLVVLRDTLQADPARYGAPSALAPLLTVLSRKQRALDETPAASGARMYAESPKSFTNRMTAYWNAWAATGSGGAAGGVVSDDAASDIPTLMSTTEAAEHLGVTPSTVRRRVRQGLLPARKVGTVWVIDAQAVRRRGKN